MLACGLAVAQPSWREQFAAAEQDPIGYTQRAETDVTEAERNGTLADQVNALRRLSLGTLASSRLADHHRAVERAEPLARRLAEPDALCWFLRLRMQRRLFEQRYEEAQRIHTEVSALATEHHLADCQAAILASRGVAANAFGRQSDAADALSKAFAIYERLDDRHQMARVLSELANVRTALNPSPDDEVAALALLERALALADPTFRRTLFELHRSTALVYQRRGKHDEAVASFKRAAELAEGLRMDNLRVRVGLSLGELHLEQHQPAPALKELDTALSRAQAARLPDRPFLLRLHLARSRALVEVGQPMAGIDALHEAERLVAPHGDASQAALYHAAAAKVFARLGNHRQAYDEMVALQGATRRVAAAADAARVDELNVRFDVALKDKDVALMRVQQEREATRRFALALALALSVAVFSALALFLRRREANALLHAQHAEALAAAEASANRAKSAFLANVSHELRSPLNTILGFTRLLQRNPGLPPSVRSDLEIVHKSGEHLHVVIDEVLDLAKIEAGEIHLNLQECPLGPLLEEVRSMFRLAAGDKAIAWQVQAVPGLPAIVRADAVKLRQVLINLVGNAMKFTQRGSVVLRAAPVQWSNDESTCRLGFAVEDTGVGIAAEELARLGEAFVQGEAGRQASEGTGIGLALTRRYVALMGGELVLRSELGRGTTAQFEIEAPVVQPSSGTVAQHIARRPIAIAGGPPAPRVLIADDKEEARRLLVELLAPLGFALREASDGQQAVTIAAEWRPHLVIMDMRMPVLNGDEAARQIKRSSAESPPIIAVSASSFDWQRDDARAAGCVEVLTKPIDEELLLQAMAKALDLRFVYDESALPAAPVDAAPETPLAEQHRARLRAALQALDIPAIEREVTNIEATNAAQARQLRQLAQRFRYAQMIELLDT
ncbi:response regulator [Aquincola sp. S2]|uniref:histidine kinase n=1 Tax=Pseudaquabacterium terrae TaxID=2732868 RepID=A0ABX2EIM2_9BURK|nr:ATP-binding protein [Aquabacterium terrae]NRF68437.1 response regulator [Aquabacterium terrae]